MTWQPISTAPMDGTFILVYSPTMEDVYRASWVTWNDGMWHPDYAECPILDEEGDVSHWMPLPPPPVEGE